MAPSVLQNGGFILGLLGAAALIAATAMNNWSVKDRQGDVVTSVYTYKGLWQDCETASSGFTECRPLYGILGFSGSFQAVRALMIVGVVLSVLGAVISVFSLTCISMISMEDTTKAKMSLTAGIMFITAGVCGIAGASIYASQIVASFRMSTNYGGNMLGGMGGGMGGMGGGMGGMGGGMGGMPTYTFGPALFVGWIGGGVLIIGGILKSLAFKELVKDEKPSYPGVVYKPQTRTKTDLSDHHSEGAKKDQNYV
ncbi:claudin-18 [Micropterus salmoides]|nr:claudin-18 [Micropterus salmoides]XP_045906791.1 claudin-18 isoform X2 [Micropterus dolomieu]XP_045906793.1 claudin-18 isoform X2 [Micropterus dolomieu]XP_045906794.1 claudin-18 isoform X2 [Micropterus dolomieu]